MAFHFRHRGWEIPFSARGNTPLGATVSAGTQEKKKNLKCVRMRASNRKRALVSSLHLFYFAEM